jgi:hypothetical protein
MGKGNNFERDISKLMSLWWTQDKFDDAIWHTSGSGGRATNRKRSNKEAKKEDHGDLKADLPIAQPLFNFFSIELKTGYAKKTKTKGIIKQTNWSLMDSLDSKQQQTQFFQFWEQSQKDADDSGREPILVFRRNNKQACISMYSDIFNAFIKRCNHPEFEYITINFCSEEFCYPQISICNLYKFFEWTKGKIKPVKEKNGTYGCRFIDFSLKRVLFNRYRGK